MTDLRKESDESLMRRVRDGDRSGVSVLVRRYASPLLTFITRMHGRGESEEIFQEVFLRLWKYRRSYKYPKPFRAWLYTIAANLCKTPGNRSLPEISSDPIGLEVVATGPSPDEAAVKTESQQMVAVALAQLPTKQRTTVVLRLWNGLTYAEIAEVLQCGEPTARSHMHHGLAQLRRHLEPRMR